jgi:hypothetical protein
MFVAHRARYQRTLITRPLCGAIAEGELMLIDPLQRRLACSVLIGLLLALPACRDTDSDPRSPREVCLIRSEAQGGLPRLYRRANASQQDLGPAPLVCGLALKDRKLADRCEDVDDLNVLLGTGKVCGPRGVGDQPGCPSYAKERVEREPPALSARPCSAADVCDNLQVAVREASGTVTRIVFYDDPACHTARQAGCEGAEHRCYYRVLAFTSELR